MKRLILSVALALIGMFLLTGGASAGNTYSYACTNTAGELQLRLNGTSAWTHTNGGAGTTIKPVGGDTIEIDGTTNSAECAGDIFVNTGGLTFKNHSGTDVLVPADDINGMFEVAGAHITIDGIGLSCTTCSTSTTNTTDLSTFPEVGALALHDGAVILFENGSIDASNTSGIYMTRGAAISVVSADISANGLNGSGAPNSSGIFGELGSSVRLGNSDGSGTVNIAGNGLNSGSGCPGFGILLSTGSSVDSFAATIGGAGTGSNDSSQNTCGQILLLSGSSARLEGTTITDTTAGSPAIQALANSSFVATTNGSTGLTINAGNNGAVLLGGASSALLNSTEIQSSGTSQATIEAAASSTVTLAGNNLITANSTGGIAFQIDHSSSLFQVPASSVGFGANAAESITGSAFVQVQSSMDIGIGLIVGAPSIVWSVGAGNCILIQQNSSFRMSGGVQINGAAPAACTLNGGAVSSTIVFQQESNGFFNVNRGGTDAFTGGGSVECLFAGMPNAHVTGKANITPAGAQPAIIGGWQQANTAVSPGCLGP